MAFLMLSPGMFSALALSTARRRRGLKLASAPPILAATLISLINLVKTLPRLASWRPLRCWMLAHLECPAMANRCEALLLRSQNSSIAPRPPGPARHVALFRPAGFERRKRRRGRLAGGRAPGR